MQKKLFRPIIKVNCISCRHLRSFLLYLDDGTTLKSPHSRRHEYESRSRFVCRAHSNAFCWFFCYSEWVPQECKLFHNIRQNERKLFLPRARRQVTAMEIFPHLFVCLKQRKKQKTSKRTRKRTFQLKPAKCGDGLWLIFCLKLCYLEKGRSRHEIMRINVWSTSLARRCAIDLKEDGEESRRPLNLRYEAC